MGRTLPRLKSDVNPSEGSSGIPVRTKKYSKWRRAYIKTPNGGDGQNNCNREKGNAIFHLPPVGHDHCDGQRTQSQHPIDRKHGERERPRTDSVFDFEECCVGFDFHCDRPAFSLVGKRVRALYRFRCCGIISWFGVTACEGGNWYGFVRGLLDDENERLEKVAVKWSNILAACSQPVFHIEGGQIQEAEEEESCVNPIGIGLVENLTLSPHRS